ncbi:hypothetical protein KHQ81_15850 (plasmid) [Mycoplasmatota bacterium]|nr:hypothetical protein KHQ81_15850 [Mycoplasmatota bacterium]
MDIPKEIKTKIIKLANIYKQASNITRELEEYFESQGINPNDDVFSFYFCFVQDGYSEDFIKYLNNKSILDKTGDIIC